MDPGRKKEEAARQAAELRQAASAKYTGGTHRRLKRNELGGP